MHSFHPSRGRILFEVLCALAISASFFGAWMQIGATALLPAAAVSLLYGFVHLFDMRGRKPAGAAEPQRIDFATDSRGDVVAKLDAEAPPVVASPQLATEDIIEIAQPAEPVAPQTSAARKAKAPRKGGGRRSIAPKEVKLDELPQAEPAQVAALVLSDDAEVAEPAPPEVEIAELTIPEEAHLHIAPLFEPEPFARMPRRAFGRKSG